MTRAERDSEAPGMPSAEDLESRAASATPSEEGGWWVSAQTAAHLLNVAARRDPQSGQVLPQPLADILSGISGTAASSTRPLPADPIQFAATFLAEPLRHILHRGRSKIVREHVLQPFHQLREMDATCSNWLGRLPGRNAREKLAGRNSALGVVREFSLDTRENRVMRRVARVLGEWVARRLEAIAAGAYDDAPEIKESLELCHELCVEDLRRSPLAEVPLSLNPEPNNVLLWDRNYSRIWRTWLSLRSLDDDTAALWRSCASRIRTALFWAFVSRLAGEPQARLGAGLARIEPGVGAAGFGISLLGVRDEVPEWSMMTTIALVLEPMLPSPRHKQGTITKVGENDRGPFGFIRSTGNESHFLPPCALGDTLSWEDLREGMTVAFIPGKVRSRSGDTRGQAPPVESVDLATGPSLLQLSLVNDGVEVEHAALAGGGLLYPVPDSTWQLRYRLHLDSTRPQARRGVKLVIEVLENGSVIEQRTTTADVGGVREFLNATTPDLIRGPAIYPAWHRGGILAGSTPVNRIGLDLGTVQPVAEIDGKLVDLGTMLFAVEYPLDSEGTAEWAVGRSDLWTEVLGTQWHVVGMADLFTADSDSNTIGDAASRMFEHIRAEVAPTGLGPATRIAYTVPDAVDEWSQYAIRSAANGVFRSALPIWRSVAAVLGWQATPEFLSAQVRPGDLVIALDVLGSGLSATFLVAQYDAELARQLPATQGLFWQRRACLTPSALPEELADRAADLTFTDLQRRYLRACSVPGEGAGAGGLPDDWVEMVQDRLVRTGIAEKILHHRRPVWLPLGITEVGVVLHVPFDADVLYEVAGEWAQALREFLQELSRNELFNELLDGSLRPGGTCHLLFAGTPFDLGEVRGAVTAAPVPRELSRFRLRVRPDAGELAASGARHFLDRLEKNLPSWRDWLPELYLEVVRDGHFHELQLMGAQLLENEATASTLGKSLTLEVEERLLLPAGQQTFQFPLQLGRRRDRLPFDASLSADVFPLAQSVNVRLELTYRYGFETAYELVVIPADSSAPFRRQNVTWSRLEEPLSEVPGFPGQRRWHRDRIDKAQAWFLGNAKDFVRKCQDFLGGRNDAEELLLGFAEARVSSWNEKLPEVDHWPEVETVGDALTVFAEWMQRALEYNMLVLWEEGNGTVNDTEVRELLDDSFLPWLNALAGLDPSTGDLSSLFAADASAGAQAVRGVALMLMSRLQNDAPANLLSILLQWLPNTTLHTVGGRHTLDAIVFALRDGRRQRREYVQALLNQTQRVLSAQPQDQESLRSVLWVLSKALWQHPHLVFAIADDHSWFISWFVNHIEQRYRTDFFSLATDADEDIALSAQWSFSLLSDLLLGILRLRSEKRFSRLLAAGNPHLLRIAWLVRRIDGFLAMRDLRVWSCIRFHARKPETLSRMSELAFVLNSYLTGDSGSNLIQIASNEDEESTGD